MRLATYASKCAENEILMYFRSTRKNAAETLLSDALDTDGDGNSLSLLDILSEDEDMDARLQSDEMCQALRRCIGEVLDAREREIIRLRYAIGGGEPLTQRETAQRCGISRSYVSRIEKKPSKSCAPPCWRPVTDRAALTNRSKQGRIAKI